MPSPYPRAQTFGSNGNANKTELLRRVGQRGLSQNSVTVDPSDLVMGPLKG